MAVELYHWGNGLPLTDGFSQTTNRYTNQFRTDSIPILTEPTIPYRGFKTLIKLHGAIWYYRQDSTVYQTENEPTKLPIEIDIGEQMMIYPTKEKPILKQPFYHFYKAFKEQRWNCLIVIGYSFRDNPVNTVILEQLQERNDCKIIVIDPNAMETILNFPDYEKFKSRFYPVTIEFGKKGYESEVLNSFR